MKNLNANAIALHSSKLTVSYKAAKNLNEFLQHLPDVVIVTSPDFNISSVNHAAEVFFGYPASYFIGTALESTIEFSFRNTSR